MKILMTGHKGLVGSIVLSRLQAMDHEITGYDLVDGNDILDTDNLVNFMSDKDAVVHLAGIPGPWQEPKDVVFTNNVRGTDSIIKACFETKMPRVVYMSSAAVYGLSKGNCKPDQFPIKEDNTLPKDEESTYYDISKRACERDLEYAATKMDLTAIALRLETPIPHAGVLASHFFASICEENLTRAVDAALTAKFEGYGAFNIHDRKLAVDEHEVKKWICENYPKVPDYRNPGDPLFDISKAINLLGYDPI